MLKISRTEKITNEEVRKRTDEEKSILRTIQQRKPNWLGHVSRHDGMLLTMLEGRTMGKRQRGRRRIQMIDNIVGKESYVKTKRKEEDNKTSIHDTNLLHSRSLKKKKILSVHYSFCAACPPLSRTRR